MDTRTTRGITTQIYCNEWVSGIHALLDIYSSNIPQQSLELLVLIIPSPEHIEALQHHLLELVKRNVHQTSRAQHLHRYHS